jgi:sigma-E factor negative regulatory protein RseC
VALEGEMAVLEARRVSGCASCSMSGACGTSTLGQMFGRKRNLLRIPNDFDARIGESVVLGLPEGDLALASLAAYMLPLLAMIGAALGVMALGGGDGLAAIASVLALGGGLWLAGRLSARAGSRFEPRFVRRASPLPFPIPAHPGQPPHERGQPR